MSCAGVSTQLYHSEQLWVGRQPFLLSRGYALRPRYQPGWTPSWGDDESLAERAEDDLSLPIRHEQIDATRIDDGRLVYIKRIPTRSEELRIAQLFSQQDLCSDQRNHSVPVLDVFQDPDEPEKSYMVMPFMHRMEHPRFQHVEEVIDFVDQILEGLVYMHEKGVAHRDCIYENILMDASGMFPEGFHPVLTLFTPDIQTIAKCVPRRDASPPVKYYFIDYGISSHFAPGQPRLVVGHHGIDQTVPELSWTQLYDPFKVDIFLIGRVFLEIFWQRYSNVGFLRPMLKTMLRRRPASRPDAATALEQWRHIRDKIHPIQRGWRLRFRGHSTAMALKLDTTYLFQTMGLMPRKFLRRLRRHSIRRAGSTDNAVADHIDHR